METEFRLFVDMDGTLARFQQVSTLEELYEPGYFALLPPQQNVVDAVKLLLGATSTPEVFILSSVLFDSRYALAEKNDWLDRNLPQLDASRRIFLPCGESKASYVPHGVRERDFLLDDYTINLDEWSQAGGEGVKLLNGINHTRGSWRGAALRHDHTPERLARELLAITRAHL